MVSIWLLCLYFGKLAQMAQESLPEEMSFVSAHVGGRVTLQCFFDISTPTKVYWFKHTLGETPRLISTLYSYSINNSFSHEFNNPRFTVNIEKGNNHLTISDLQISDSASYYCIHFLYTIQFSKSFFVSVKGSGLSTHASVKQSTTETIWPGGPVTLNCTVQTGSCDGEHNVYWFTDSEESHPGLIYTHDGCDRKPNTKGNTCDYTLPVKNMNNSRTYYCAVASCGHILFGNGTKLHYQVPVLYVSAGNTHWLVLVTFLCGALTFTTILCIILGFLLYRTKKRSRKYTGSQAGFPNCSTTNTQGCQEADSLHYAALSDHRPKRSRTQQSNTHDDCVYSHINA
ncbi:uncharacterized protein KZ484_002504 isoform 1-T1 [Pholidichthys leucotaenia]